MQKEPVRWRQVLSTDMRAPILKHYQKERRIHHDCVERKENKIWFRYGDFNLAITHLFEDVRALKAGRGKS